VVAAQANVQIDAEIGQKDHFRMEIKRLRGGDLAVAAQANVQIDAEIGQKDHFRMETTQARSFFA